MQLLNINDYVKYIYPFIVAAFWGLSTPYLRTQSKGIERIKDPNKSFLSNWINELRFMFLNYKYLIAFLCNQAGSVLFVVTLAEGQLSLIVPLVNSLSLIFTFIGDLIVGDTVINKYTVGGVALIASGIAVCVYSKL